MKKASALIPQGIKLSVIAQLPKSLKMFLTAMRKTSIQNWTKARRTRSHKHHITSAFGHKEIMRIG